jgi:restriction system protein
MLPLLQYLSDNKERRYSETMEYLKEIFQLKEEEYEEEKSSGGKLFYNRIGWAKDYLTRAGLLEKKTGRFQITSRGLEILKQNPSRIDKKFLMQFKEFVPYVSSGKEIRVVEEKKDLNEQSPDDLIDIGIDQINNILKNDLVEKLKSVDPTFFEKLIVDLVEKLGYGKGRHIGKSGDKGVDGEIPQDKLGLDMIYLQAKRYSANVSAHEVRDFMGALSLKKARKGILITTSDFNSEAYEDVKKSEKNIVLINGKKLIELMIENNIGAKTKKSFLIKEMDSDYFDE